MKKETIVIVVLLALLGLSSIAPFFSQKDASTTSPNQSTPSISSTFGFKQESSSIAVIKIYGPIQFGDKGNMFQPQSSVESWLQELKDIESNSDVKALILRINSPGGTVGASQEFFEAVQLYKEKTKIPVIASIADMGTSGAYWIALSADIIFANPGSMVGNIGVILGNLNFEDLAKKLGVHYQVFKSGQYKDILSSWRTPSEQEDKILQNMVDNIHLQFVDVLASSRGLKKDTAAELANGQIFTGTQAKNMGLIDQVGSLQSAVTFVKKEFNLPEDAEPTSMRGNSFKQWMNSFKSLDSLFSVLNLAQTVSLR
ncbi:signal peptide peptidase SppA [bacterium]|mgnify:CR=1 FL=1|jgi:protease IV|nr:signal peptide peptidase SppA [bacterium]